VTVLDASAALELLSNSAGGREIERRLESRIHAPHILDLEIANALRRQCNLRVCTPGRAAQALQDLRSLLVVRHSHHPHLDRIWELRGHFTAYDACYLALTEALGATLLTCDQALASARLERGQVAVI